MTLKEVKETREQLERGLVILINRLRKKIEEGDKLTNTELQTFLFICKSNNVTINPDAESLDEQFNRALSVLQNEPYPTSGTNTDTDNDDF